MKKIPLTQGKFAIVDDEDYERIVAMGSWHFNNGYASSSLAYKKPNGKWGKKTLYMHRAIMHLDFLDKRLIDHINHDRLDNRRKNLRICSHLQNIRNSKKQKNNTSGYKGVSFNKNSQKFRAQIRFNNKNMCIGSFECPKEAAKAYNEAALKYHGEFANLNKVE